MAPDEEELYQEHILDHYEDPYHRGRCPACTHAHEDNNPLCGDVIRMELQIDDQGTLKEVYFDGDGCCISQAAASMLVEKFDGQHDRRGQAVHRQRHARSVRRPADAQPAEVLPAVVAGVAGGHLLAASRGNARRPHPGRAGGEDFMTTAVANPAVRSRAVIGPTFPILARTVHDGVPLVYLDNAATTPAAAAGDPGDRRRLRAALRQRPSRHPHAGRGDRRAVRGGPGEGPGLHQRPHARRQPATSRSSSPPARPRAINLVARSWGDANVRAGRRNPAHRDGAPLEPRALAATGRADRRGGAPHSA